MTARHIFLVWVEQVKSTNVIELEVAQGLPKAREGGSRFLEG